MRHLSKFRILPVLVVLAVTSLFAAALVWSGSSTVDRAKLPEAVAREFVAHRRIVADSPAAEVDAHLLRHALDASNDRLAAVFRAADERGLAAALEELRRYHRTLPRTRYVQVFPTSLWKESSEQLRAEIADVLQHGCQLKDFQPFPLTAPVKWDADPYDDRSWRFKLNAWHFLDPFLVMYERDGKPADLELPVAATSDWIDYHIGQGHRHEFAWYDMAAGRRAAMMAKILDAALADPQVQISDKQLLNLLVTARIHLKYLSTESHIAWHSNHGLAQLAGLLALTTAVPELQDATAGRAFAASSVKKLYRQHFTDEGIHKEHSPVYHVELTNFLGHLMEKGLIDDPEMQQLFADASASIISYVHPDGHLSRVGDGDTVVAKQRVFFEPDPQLDYVLSRGQRGTPPAEPYQIYPQSGYATFRSDWTQTPWDEAGYLFFSASFFSRTHKQADDFTFEWADRGRELIIDSGKYIYNREDPIRQFIVSTRAHNTVEIDEQDYSRYRNDAFGSAITAAGRSDDGVYFVEAEVYRKRYFRTTHKRILAFQPGGWLAVIDQLKSRSPHTYTQWFHFAPDLNVQSAAAGFSADLDDRDQVLRMIPLATPTALKTTLVKGQEEPRRQGWTSLQYGKLTPNVAAGFTAQGRNETFVTLLWLGDRSATLKAGDTSWDETSGRFQVRWLADGRTHGFDYHRTENRGTLTLVHPPAVTADRPRRPVQ